MLPGQASQNLRPHSRPFVALNPPGHITMLVVTVCDRAARYLELSQALLGNLPANYDIASFQQACGQHHANLANIVE
jgi:hypothetical protein